MPLDCSLTCGDYTPLTWSELSQLEQQFLIYCALNAAGGGGGGPFQSLGVYTATEDSDYVVPADASLIIWNVPTQSGTRSIDFSQVPEGSEVQVLVVDSNGQDVIDSYNIGGTFVLNDVAPYVVNVRTTDGAGSIVRSDGTAAQYDVGTSGGVAGLLNGNWVKTGTTEFQGNVEIDGSTRLYFSSTIGPYLSKAGSEDGFDFTSATGGYLRVLSFGAIYGSGAGNMFLQGAPAVTGHTILEDGTGLGLILGTASNTPIRIMPNRSSSAVADFTTAGTLIATSGVGGTRIAKLSSGIATMVAGTVSIPDIYVTAGSSIDLTPGFALSGQLYYQKNPGVGFTINSTNGSDAGEVSWSRKVI